MDFFGVLESWEFMHFLSIGKLIIVLHHHKSGLLWTLPVNHQVECEVSSLVSSFATSPSWM
jgi:hypothetical protein